MMRHLRQRYTRLYRLVQRKLRNGDYQRLSARRQRRLWCRLTRYEHRLRRAGIAIAATAALMAGSVELTAQAAPLSDEAQVNTYTTSDQNAPDIAMDADGDYVVVWWSRTQDGDGGGIYGQRYSNAGAATGSEFLVNTTTTGYQINPSVAMASDGDFVVVWQSNNQDGSNYGIYAQRYNSSGVSLGDELLVNTYTTNSQSQPAVAMDDDGNFVVVWQSTNQDGDGDGIFARVFNSDGTAVDDNFAVNAYTTNAQRNAAVAMDADGDFVVAWQSQGQDGSGLGIYAQRFDNMGAAVGSELLVNSFTSLNQSFPSVAMDDAGNFVVAWQSADQDGNNNGVYAQRYSSDGNAMGGELAVNTYTTAGQFPASVAMDADGDFVIAWGSYGQDGNGTGVFVRQYDAQGNALSNEFQVNETTTDDQSTPVIAMDADGNFGVAWQSYGQDGSYYGIYARRYSSEPVSVLPISQTDIEAYPNPVTSILTLKNLSPSSTVRLYDLAGKEVTVAAIGHGQVDVTGLLSGVYLLEITDAGRTVVAKVVKH